MSWMAHGRLYGVKFLVTPDNIGPPWFARLLTDNAGTDTWLPPVGPSRPLDPADKLSVLYWLREHADELRVTGEPPEDPRAKVPPGAVA